MKFARIEMHDGFTLVTPEGATIIDKWHAALEINGRLCRPETITKGAAANSYHLYFEDKTIVWQWHCCFSAGRLSICSKLRNDGAAPITLGKAFSMKATPTGFTGKGAEVVALGSRPGGVGQLPRPVRAIDHADAPRQSMIKFQFYDRVAQQALQVGYTTFSRCHTIAEYECDAAGRLAQVGAYSEFAGWKLAPDSETQLETFTLAWGSDPLAQLEEWGAHAAIAGNFKFRMQPALAACCLAWSIRNSASESCAERLFANLEALQKKLPGFGLEFVWVSIDNLTGGNPGAWLDWNYDHLPAGLDGLVAQLAHRGVKLGLWCGPFYISSGMPQLVAELDEALLRNDKGERLIVKHAWSHGDAGLLPMEKRPDLYALDPTHPRSIAFIRRSFAHFRKAGVRYFMIDFLEAGAAMLGAYPYENHYNAEIVKGPEALNHFLAAIRETAGSDTYLLASSGPTLHCAGNVDAMRTGSDFGEGRAIKPDTFFYPASYVINGVNFWIGPGWALRNMAANFYTHRKLYLNDSGNVLTVDTPIPLEDARIHAAIHGFSGASTVLGDDYRFIDPERLRLVKATLPRSPEVARPLDLFKLPDNAVPHIFLHRVKRKWDEWGVYALFNMEPTEVEVEIEISEPSIVWEFWNRRYLGCHEGSLRLKLAAGTVRIYRIAPRRGLPQLLGSDMHMAMGEMEVSNWHWNSSTLSLAVEATRPAGEEGSLYIYVPHGLYVKNFTDCFVAKDANDESLIVRLPYSFDNTATATRKLEFGYLEGKTEITNDIKAATERYA